MLLEDYKIRDGYFKDGLYFVIVGTGVVSYWRGVWTLVSFWLFPTNDEDSGWASIAIGYGGLFFYYLCTILYHYMSSKEEEFDADALVKDDKGQEETDGTKLRNYVITKAKSYLNTMYIGFCVVNCWRGIWVLEDYYIYPDDMVLSSWITTVSGVVALMCINRFQSVLAPPGVDLKDSDFAATKMKCVKYFE